MPRKNFQENCLSDNECNKKKNLLCLLRNTKYVCDCDLYYNFDGQICNRLFLLINLILSSEINYLII